ncbi:hypothetical protein [Actinoplanes sp. NPDC051851]|uniref:hypothetical protein n=1 Tax=Actinoplanes sp. NPDC051851 TaxID=3154753 RepID=UPI00341D2270
MNSNRLSGNRLSLVVALLAGGVLLASEIPAAPAVPAQPMYDISDLPDLKVDPLLFMDRSTAVGVLDGTRLVIESAGSERELRRGGQFDNLTRAGDELLWTESRGEALTVWAANLATGAAPRQLTADTGNAIFSGNQYDLVVADGRVHWAAAPNDGDDVTQIRSVALTGGPVETDVEPGQWSLTAWPWITDDAGGAGAGRLRNLDTTETIDVPTSGAEWSTCSPTWCRVMVMSAAQDLARIDLMHPDGSGRRRIAGPTARAGVDDVAVLDRFEILAEPGPHSDVTGTAALVLFDLRTGRTGTVDPAAGSVFTHDGMLWWQSASTWHTLDLRTVNG